MQVSGEAYSQRLETFSDDTLRLIMQLQTKATHKEANQIVAKTDYSEEEVVEKLTALLQTLPPTETPTERGSYNGESNA